MNTEDNVVDFGEWQGDDKAYQPTEEEWQEAARELFLMQDAEQIAITVALVLELLTAKAMEVGSFYFKAETGNAITLVAVNDEANAVLKVMPESIANWTDIDEEPADEFLTDQDPGDEQDEPAS